MSQSVTMPDGTIHNFPDAATPEMISGALGLASHEPSHWYSSVTEPIAGAISSSMQRGDNPISLGLQTMGAEAKPIVGATMDVAKSIPGVKPIGNVISSGAQSVADAIDSTKTGQAAGDTLFSGTDRLSNIARTHPETAANINAVGNIAAGEGIINAGRNLAEGALNTDLAKDTSSSSGPVASIYNAAKEKIVNAPERPPIAADLLGKSSQNAYKYSENVGGVLHPDNFTNPVLDIIEDAKVKPTDMPGGVLTSQQRALNAALDEYAGMRDHPMTLDQFQNFDKSLTAKESAAMENFKPTNNSRIIGQVQDKIRDRLENLTESDVIGGKEGFDALTQHAIPLWSAKSKLEDLETLINKANDRKNPAMSMQTALSNLANSPKINRYPAEVQDLIRKGAKSGKADDLLGIVGSRLNPIVSSTPTGKIVSMGTSAVSRNIRDAMQNAKADRILSAMTDPVRDSVEKFATLPESPYPFKPEVPVAPSSPYTVTGAKELGKYAPSTFANAAIDALRGIGEKETEVPVAPGGASTYYAKGGAVKPTDAQKSAGNYKKEHISFQGLPITIENAKGSIRSGKDKGGKEWSCKMPCAYGYFKGSEAKDGDHVDCFIGPNPKSLRVYVIDQKHHDTGKYDEAKCMLGFPTREAALSAYRASFSDKKNRIMHVRKMLMPEFKEWLRHGNTKKPIKSAS